MRAFEHKLSIDLLQSRNHSVMPRPALRRSTAPPLRRSTLRRSTLRRSTLRRSALRRPALRRPALRRPAPFRTSKIKLEGQNRSQSALAAIGPAQAFFFEFVGDVIIVFAVDYILDVQGQPPGRTGLVFAQSQS